jgi:hypothetical protein
MTESLRVGMHYVKHHIHGVIIAADSDSTGGRKNNSTRDGNLSVIVFTSRAHDDLNPIR